MITSREFWTIFIICGTFIFCYCDKWITRWIDRTNGW